MAEAKPVDGFSKQDAECDAPPRLFRIIPPELRSHKSPDRTVSFSPFCASSLGDFNVFSSVCPSLNGAAASADDGSHCGDVKDHKDDEETVSPRGTIVEGSGISTPRKKKNGVSALTYALQMESAKKVKPVDGFEIKPDKQDSDANDSEEGRQPTYPDQLSGSEEDAECEAPPRLFRVISPEPKASISSDSIVSCSPFRPASLEDFNLFPSVCSSLNGAAASVDGKSGEFTPAKDELVAAAQDTASCDSIVVLRDGSYVSDNVEDEKRDEETVSPRDTSTADSKKPTSRKKKHGVSALTLLLQMEAAKKDVPKEVKEVASGSDNGGNNAVQPLQNTYEGLEYLPQLPVRVWSTDGHPVIKENWSDFHPEELVTPLRFEVHQDGTVRFHYEVPGVSSDSTSDQVDGPNVLQRCFMWCGRMFCWKEYEEI